MSLLNVASAQQQTSRSKRRTLHLLQYHTAYGTLLREDYSKMRRCVVGKPLSSKLDGWNPRLWRMTLI